MNPDQLMQIALAEARKAFDLGEVPIGAVLACNDEVLVCAHNQVETDAFAGAHAEMLVLQRAASQLGRWRLSDCCLAVTLEPCAMCMGAIRLARIGTLIFGAADPRMGAVGSVYDLAADTKMGPLPQVVKGVCEEACAKLLKDFFKQLRTRT